MPQSVDISPLFVPKDLNGKPWSRKTGVRNVWTACSCGNTKRLAPAFHRKIVLYFCSKEGPEGDNCIRSHSVLSFTTACDVGYGTVWPHSAPELAARMNGSGAKTNQESSKCGRKLSVRWAIVERRMTKSHAVGIP